MKVAFLAIPSAGGPYTVFKTLRAGLLQEGIELSWLMSGRTAMGVVNDNGFAGELAFGRVVAPDTDEELPRAQALQDYVRRESVQAVVCGAQQGSPECNWLRYLPSEIRRILLVHNITPTTYRAARAMRDWVHATVGVSPRIADDLTARHGFDPGCTFCIPNAVDLSAFEVRPDPRGANEPLRLLFLGRVEDTAKGVLWMPKILSRVLAKGTAVRLSVAGDGPDLPALRKALSGPGLQATVDFVGLIPLADVPGLVARHDVFLMPSRFEGFPLTLIEAMAGGCVPVASRIRGVTDFVVEDGRCGCLFPVGAVGAAADCIIRLDRDRTLLASLSRAARVAVVSRFSAAEQARRYAELLRNVLERPGPLPEPRPLERWEIHPGLLPGWWSRLPLPLKNALRVARERLR